MTRRLKSAIRRKLAVASWSFDFGKMVHTHASIGFGDRLNTATVRDAGGNVHRVDGHYSNGASARQMGVSHPATSAGFTPLRKLVKLKTVGL